MYSYRRETDKNHPGQSLPDKKPPDKNPQTRTPANKDKPPSKDICRYACATKIGGFLNV